MVGLVALAAPRFICGPSTGSARSSYGRPVPKECRAGQTRWARTFRLARRRLTN